MKTLEFAEGLRLPIDAVTQTFAFLARKGAGKTYGASKLAEGMLGADAQVVVVDPVGVWWGLRMAADGKAPGIPIAIFGGLHGDLPLEPTAGGLVADLVVDKGVSLVLDVSMFRKGDRKRFVTDFAEQLFHRKKGERTPMHLFVEEAQVFVPQRVMGDEARMLGAFEDLVKLGRNFGIGVTLISQRPQAVNKDALNQTECLVVLQTNGAQERKAIREWIVEQGLDVSELVDTLPSLERGEAWVWSPSWLRKTVRVHISEKWTFNASATPEVGKKTKEAPKLEELALESIREAMAATVQAAEANDPKALRRRIAELERKLSERPEAKPEVQRMEVPVLQEKDTTALMEAMGELGALVQSLGKDLEATRAQLKRALFQGKPIPSISVGYEPPGGRKQWERDAWGDMQGRRSAPRKAPAEGGPSAYAMQLLETAAARLPMRPTRTQLAILSGRSTRSSAYQGAVAELLKAGLLIEERGQLAITREGLRLVGHVESSATSPEQIRETWLRALPQYEGSLLRILIERYPKPIDRIDLAHDAGKSILSSAYQGAISTLKKNGLVEAEADGRLRASETLFLSGAA